MVCLPLHRRDQDAWRRIDEDGQEARRLDETRGGVPWKAWGPYLSERQWGTVREDYSDNGDAWSYFSHDQARSRAYRWGEDGIAGHLRRPPAPVLRRSPLWNGVDPILKERMFGLTNAEGNHGEDVKEYYFYLDATPTALLPEVPVPVPAAASSRTATSSPPTAPARPRRSWSTSCSTPGCSTTTATSTSTSSTPRRHPTTSTCRITVTNRSAERRDGAPAADAVVPQHVVDGPAQGQPACAVDDRRVITAEHPELGDARAAVRRRAGAAVHRERDEHRAAVGAAERARRT